MSVPEHDEDDGGDEPAYWSIAGPLPLNTALPRLPDGTPEVDEADWNEAVRHLATELFGTAEFCLEKPCRRAGQCRLRGAPCIRRMRPEVDLLVVVTRLYLDARLRFAEAMRARRAAEANAAMAAARPARRKRRPAAGRRAERR